MQKITFTREQVTAAYDEICRRLALEYTEELVNETATDDTYNEQCYYLRHGLYSVFSAQSRLVQQLVAKGPAIFLGRCTGQILKTEARVPFVHAFVYASNMQDRIDRARNVDGVEASRIEAYIKRRDNQRKNYNKFFSDKTTENLNQVISVK